MAINRSKAYDLRWQARWDASGASGTLRDAEKNRMRREYGELLSRNGALSPDEVKTLVRFEYGRCPTTVEGQVLRYYLKFKADKPEQPERAVAFRQEADALLGCGIKSEDDIVKLIAVIYKYSSGSLLRYEGHTYYMTRGSLGKS
jgi:hypothetical protein